MVKESIDYKLIIDILEDVLGYHKNHNEIKGQISFDCPVCSYEIKGLDQGDGKGNLEVNYKQNVYKCWVCYQTHETHGSMYKLIKKYGNPRLLKKFQILMPDFEYTVELAYKRVYLPKEFIPFDGIHPAFKLTPHYKQAKYYLDKRNITEDIIKKYNIGYCYQGEYANRIIIPSYDEDEEVNYFIARSYLEKAKLKYKNPQAAKETIIFNERLIDWNDKVYIVEGVFDSIFLENSIPLLGKFVSEKLFNLLYENAKEIVIILDGDAWEDAQRLYHRINCGKLMGKVWVVRLPLDKDLADLRGDISNYELKKID